MHADRRVLDAPLLDVVMRLEGRDSALLDRRLGGRGKAGLILGDGGSNRASDRGSIDRLDERRVDEPPVAPSCRGRRTRLATQRAGARSVA